MDVSIERFVPASKHKGYGHDLLTTLGKTADGTVVEITADQIMSVVSTYRASDKELTVTTLDPVRDAEVKDAAKALGIKTGSLEVRPGNAHLFKPIKDAHAAKMSAIIEAVAGSARIGEDHKVEALAQVLGRPSGALLPGGSAVTTEGKVLFSLNIPDLYLVEVRAPGEKRTIPQPELSDELLKALERVNSLEELLTVTEPLMAQYRAAEQIAADLHELQTDLPPIPGMLPAADTGVAIPYEQTHEGFKAAEEMRDAIKALIPSVSCFITKSWKRKV